MLKYLVTFFLIASSIAFSQDLDCTDFRTGEFRYTDPNLSGIIVIRTEKLQIERYEETGEEVHLYIDWISECEYTLTYKKIINPSTKRLKKNMTGKEMPVKILKIEGNVMTYFTKFEGMELTGDLQKILDN
ncbi:hypothetical protein [Flavobacterium aquatile]|uniref:DNA topoisomerase IV subunit A n=1 Tax=Flavobacterium aquatile LMG 4008 = ATCC 11947 TaxID=1453498 RepID=A0A095SV45_9FLAO|nr:hypothetical protein [Flavobacterium aquatile]KGD68239.1 hypothetical protein LG45_08070 [Flavobacterium aquatile LMG 4008 = ATCC 11947]OXA68826.1 hypothetical protein B0A61_03725 [Flavobacterium aquatile LMG 4008 = ATCC 11947]GEC77287.1 hypothetical protein FAQ01_01570 [Flavobacterium aquatile]